MKNKKLIVQKLNSPLGGAISSIAIVNSHKTIAYAGTNVGIFRWDIDLGWEKLINSPLGVICLVSSPNFDVDHTIFAGTPEGIFYSLDEGLSWQLAKMPIVNSTVLALACSPGFSEDGIMLAGTLEDGVLYSQSYGRAWETRNFGILDQTIYSLAFSPQFSTDGVAFLGAQSNLYKSYNFARAWKEFSFPEDSFPIFSLCISPQFVVDQTIFAGTENQGLFITTNGGNTWQHVNLPSKTINAICIQGDKTLISATELGIWISNDFGKDWHLLLELPGVLSLSAKDEMVLVGSYDQGIWMSVKDKPMKFETYLPARSFSSVNLSDNFNQVGLGFLMGIHEGLWRTSDFCNNWQDLTEKLEFQEIHQIALSTNPYQLSSIYVATSSGLWYSSDAGENWNGIFNEPVEKVSLSPDGKIISIALPGKGIRFSLDHGISWINLPGPWDQGGKILAIEVTDQMHFFIALLEGIGEILSFYQGKMNELKEVIQVPVIKNPVVSIWIPNESIADRPWYASLGSQVWKFSSRRAGAKIQKCILNNQNQEETIIALTGRISEGKVILYACTGFRIYISTDNALTWSIYHDFDKQRAVSMQILPEGSLIILLLGGELIKLSQNS